MNVPIIIDELGLIYGRDAIYLDDIIFENDFTRVRLVGDFNGMLCQNVKEEKWIKYQIVFKGIEDFRLIKENLFDDSQYASSFEQVLNSNKIRTNKQKHYLFHTYDHIIEVLAEGFEIRIG